MRDIRPQPSNQPKLPPGDTPRELPPNVPRQTGAGSPKATLAKSSSARQWRGSTVPVTNIHVPPPEKVLRSGTAPAAKPVAFTPRPVKSPPAQRQRRAQLRGRERTIVLGLIGLLGIAGLLAAALFLPRADIKLVLRTAPLLVDEKLTLRAEAAADGAAIPGSAFFREVTVEGSAPVTGTEVVGTKAQGTVQLVNRSTDEQKIKEGSRLVTKSGELFYMQQSATLPAAAGGPARVSVEVEAAEAGVEGNIEPQRLDFAALDASSQTLVYAEATAALTGGSGEEIKVVTEADLTAAREAAGAAAQAQVEQEIREELPSGWVVLDESWTKELLEFTADAEIGERVQTIAYTARVAVRVMGYEQESLETRLRSALEERLDAEYMLFPGPISYTKSVESVNWDAAEAVVATRVTHTTIPQLSLDTLRSKLAGRSEEEAKQYLEGLPGVRSVTLDLSPFWVQSIPRIEKRILLDLQPERQP